MAAVQDKIVRINMKDLTARFEDTPSDWKALGGRALTSRIVSEEVPPLSHPLGSKNRLVFAPGLLTGTPAANSGRLSAGAKSPLTGTIKEANAGGTAAQALAKLGIKAVVIEDKPEKGWYGIRITKNGVEIFEEKELIGAGNFQVVDEVVNRYGKQCSVVTIGPAGEMKMLAANISVKDPDGKLRSHGRGGLGAVMGSKGVKFVAIDPQGAEGIHIADKEAFTQASKLFSKGVANHDITKALAEYGTDVLINIIHNAGGLPTRNFTKGQFDGHDGIAGETMNKLIKERGGKVRHNCQKGCIIMCSQVYNDKQGRYKTSGFEYESIWAMGADCCVDNLDILAEADHWLDDLGLDTVEIGVAFGVAMEAGVLDFGDGKRMVQIIKEDISKGTPLGRIIGNGAATVGRAYGVTRVPVVKNQAIPAYDPRAIKGIGITYATSTMGADHTAGYTIAANILGSGGNVDPLSKEGQIELSRNLQIATAAIDSTGLCLFTAFAILDDERLLPAIVDMINARFGTTLAVDDVMELGKSVLKMEREFNLRAGFTNEDDRLPEFFSNEPLPPHNAVWDFTGEEIDAFWDF